MPVAAPAGAAGIPGPARRHGRPPTSDGHRRTAFARALAAWMERQGLTQEDLAADLGTVQPVVSRLVRGVRGPTVEFVAALVRRYDLPPGEWFSLAGLDPEGRGGEGRGSEGRGGEGAKGRPGIGLEREYDAGVYAVRCLRRLQREYGDAPEAGTLPVPPPDTPPEAVHCLIRLVETQVRRRIGLPLSGGLFLPG